VLLKNEGDILPLKPETKVAIIGDFADKPRYQGAGSSIVNPIKVESALEVAKEEGSGINFIGYEPGFKRYGKKSKGLRKKACALASKADVVLYFLGLDEHSETEGLDRKTMAIPKNQLDLLEKLHEIGTPIVCVLSAGSPVELPFVDNVNALVHGYLGGEAGARAMIEVLAGKVNPSGKLSETLPYTYEDCPSAETFGWQNGLVEYREGPYIGYRYFSTADISPRFPFGYGLSYTSFEYSDLKVDEKGVSFKIKNTGSVAGKEVAEMYIGLKESMVFRPAFELKGFAKVEIKPGETKEVSIPFDEYTFRYFNILTNKWEVEAGDYDVYVGPSSASFPLVGKIHQEGTNAPAPYDKEKLPSYFSGKVRRVDQEEFETLLGRKIEEPVVFIKKNRIMVTPETTIYDLRYAKGWFGRFFEWAIRVVIKILPAFGNRSLADTMTMGMYYTPLRNMSRASGGMIGWGQLGGLIMMCNGKFFKGLHEFIHQGKVKKQRKKARDEALENAAKKALEN
ncbi:MAG: glycoside hydrolase family 3 C-terminal domain-containing protein, partial [Bacilli bacterium]|nr:glycoside hydrolase family 3 C-terminal domain-containing protein [Bacilli bacterium]